ncbi:MAG: MBL fold metallo-hydrolase [Chloroflexi bacterium]|nr:MBL fold metallo-hydrolase [Chloroflexota bacterium]
MIFQRIKSDGLAHNSYFIGSGNEVAVIDPRRDCEIYVELAQKYDFNIKYIFETHRNEDYMIGSLELSSITEAEIYHGTGIDWKYGSTLSDRDEFHVGTLIITALHTPGHTKESISYAVAEASAPDNTIMVFTGDTLLINAVGRTDLYGSGEASELAAQLYDSIFNNILPLGDGVIICPAHGAGSICGSNIGDRDDSTIGIEKKHNPMLQLNKEEFIKVKLAEKLERPHYFLQMEKYNLEGPPILGRLPVPSALTPAEFKYEMENGDPVVIDTSMPHAFGGAHIRNSYSIWLGGLPVFAGWVLFYDEPVLLILQDDHNLERAIRDLVRVGFDKVIGYLKGGIASWYNAGYMGENLPMLPVNLLKLRLEHRERLTILDVRDENEWSGGHIKGAVRIYAGHLNQRLAEVPRDRPVAVICSVGNRTSLAASILLRAGYREVYNVLGGMKAWVNAGYTITKD